MSFEMNLIKLAGKDQEDTSRTGTAFSKLFFVLSESLAECF